MDMRNLNVQRARQTHIQLQRIRDKHQPQAVVVTSELEEMLKSMARFDLHLRRRPSRPDMQDFITSPATTDLWINEQATTTLAGIFIGVNALIEEAAQLLASWWRYADKWSAVFPPPVAKWIRSLRLGLALTGSRQTQPPFFPSALLMSGHYRANGSLSLRGSARPSDPGRPSSRLGSNGQQRHSEVISGRQCPTAGSGGIGSARRILGLEGP
jgi:hypothetical protein